MNDGMIKKEDLENKYVFWDIDGTLAAYRFNDHVSDPDGTDNGMSLKEIKQGVFLNRKPSILMQNVIKNSNIKENIIIGQCKNQKEMNDKMLWLDRYYPMIKERILIYDISKADHIINYCKSNNINLKDVVYVDDVLPFLREAERKNIKSYHISSFLDFNLNK